MYVMKTFEGLKEEFTRYTFSLVLNLKYYMLSLRTAKLLFYVIADRKFKELLDDLKWILYSKS